MIPDRIAWVFSGVAGLVLLVAGGMKAQDAFFGGIGTVPSIWVCGQIFLELCLGVWLLLGVYPRLARLLALGVFLVFMNVALWSVLENQPSCKCFGKYSVRPWIALTLDVGMVGGLAFVGRFLRVGALSPWYQRRVMALGVVVMILSGALLRPVLAALNKSNYANLPKEWLRQLPQGVDEDLVARVIHGLQKNRQFYEQFKSTYTLKKVADPNQIMGVDFATKQLVKITGKPVVESKMHVKFACKGDHAFWVHALVDDSNPKEKTIKSDRYDFNGWGVAVDSDWSSLRFYPSTGFENGAVFSSNPLCPGLRPPVNSVAEYLQKNTVENAGWVQDHLARKVVRMRVKGPPEQKPQADCTIDFSPDYQFMPTRVVYWFRGDGGVVAVSDMEYDASRTKPGFVPVRITQRCFVLNTTQDPNAREGYNIHKVSELVSLENGVNLPVEVFDPLIPPNLKIANYYTNQKVSDPVEHRRASSYIKKKFLGEDWSKKVEAFTAKPVSFPWKHSAILGLVDLVVLGAGWFLRGYIFSIQKEAS